MQPTSNGIIFQMLFISHCSLGQERGIFQEKIAKIFARVPVHGDVMKKFKGYENRSSSSGDVVKRAVRKCSDFAHVSRERLGQNS